MKIRWWEKAARRARSQRRIDSITGGIEMGCEALIMSTRQWDLHIKLKSIRGQKNRRGIHIATNLSLKQRKDTMVNEKFP